MSDLLSHVNELDSIILESILASVWSIKKKVNMKFKLVTRRAVKQSITMQNQCFDLLLETMQQQNFVLSLQHIAFFELQ